MRVKFKKQINRGKFYRTLFIAMKSRYVGMMTSSYVIKTPLHNTYLKYVEFCFQGFLYRMVTDLSNHSIAYYRYNLKGIL